MNNNRVNDSKFNELSSKNLINVTKERKKSYATIQKIADKVAAVEAIGEQDDFYFEISI